MWQLIGFGVIGIAVMLFIGAHDSEQREIGEANANAKHAKQDAAIKIAAEKARADQEQLLADAAEDARADAVKQVVLLKKRQTEARAALETQTLTRKVTDDARAKDDITFALWREGALPPYVVDTDAADRVRIAAILGLGPAPVAGAGGGGVSAGTGVQGRRPAAASGKDQR